MSALETQSDQLSLQASQECERLHSDRTHTLQMLQKVLTKKLGIYNRVQEPFATEWGGLSYRQSNTSWNDRDVAMFF